MSALAERRAALVEKLVEAVIDYGWDWDNSGAAGDERRYEAAADRLRARFTALLASRWQT